MVAERNGHAGRMATQNGYLVVADVSGYTAFTLRSEIDHAQGIMAGLLGAIVTALAPPVSVSKLEGDAVFAHAPAAGFRDQLSLMDALERAYSEFRDLRDQMARGATCPCAACRNMRALDLKIVAHHGEYAVGEIAGRTELSGPDVIAVHRLIKNRVAAATGIDAYLFVTDAATAAMGLRPEAAGMIRHREEVEGIGAIAGWASSLEDAWTRRRESRRVRVAPEDALVVVEETVPVGPAAAWDFMHADENNRVWSLATEILRVERSPSGRNDVGLERHCLHGRDEISQFTIDWRPYDYFTTDMRINDRVRTRHTMTLEPAGEGARLRWAVAAPTADGAVMRLMTRAMRPMLRRRLRRNFGDCLAKLREMIEAEAGV